MLQHKVNHYREHNLLREIAEVPANHINFSSNDYLGISQSHKVKQAFIEGVNLYGFGSGSSPLISGYYSSTRRLEEEFAQILNTEQAMFFNSGYHANLGLIQALNMPVIMDKLCHASIIDGARLSGQPFYRYRHNNLKHAEELLQQAARHPWQAAKQRDRGYQEHYSEDPRSPTSEITSKRALLISERVFSMEGDIADIEGLKALSKYLIIDDAHGFGILENNIQSFCTVIPLGKALGGMGAIVAGSKDLIEYLRQFARSYAYSTALPPAIAHANLTALKVMTEETWRLDKLKALIEFFNLKAKFSGLNLASLDPTPIRSILIDDNSQAKLLEKKLYEQGFFVKAIVKPTVQISRLRISLCAHHKKEDIIKLIEVISERLFQ